MKQGLAVVAVMSVLMAGAEERCVDDRVPFADPFVLCHGGKYYAYGTSGEDGIGVAVSDDLRTWRWWQGAGKDGYALHKDDSWGKKWFWAPEVYARDGHFVMYYSAEVHVCAAVAESPLGPFRQIKKEPLLPSYSAIDNTLVDADGKVRMFFTGGPDGKPWAIYSVEMSADGLTADPKTVRPVVHAEQSWEKHTGGCVNEGSFVVRVGDRYVLSYSGNDYQDHLYGLGIATAKDIDGPWTKFAGNPVFQRGFGLYGTGHHALFKDNAGRWRIVFHAHNSEKTIHPRCMYIADVDFPVGADGEPTMKVGGELITCRKAAADAKPPEWEDLKVNSINRLPPRTYSMPLADEKAALTDALEPETPYKKSLNGIWKLSWAGNPDLRVREFWKEGFDDSNWFDIDVPSCVELRGFGSPGYTNVRYPHKMAWPKILDRKSGKPDYNPVSSYRTAFTVPADWKGRDVILRFDGVYSAYYVWVNGKFVGYAEDSKLPSEFDVTPYLHQPPATNHQAPGTNTLAVEVYRWCDGSYLEDQDMTRYSGIFRDVTLWAKPKDGIWDFTVVTSHDEVEGWRLKVEVEADAVKLYDGEFNKVADLTKDAKAPLFNLQHSTFDLRSWSAEKPYLYTLVVKKGDDIRMKRVGFKDQKIVGNTFKVNGQPVKFKGVNRHETSPANGRTVSLDDMLADITLMKRYNINAVRTSHYPNHHLWYDLCDRYGIYLIAEANVEGHEPGYKEKGLGQFSEWDHSIVERNVRHMAFYRNNPSVTMWSLGNETGHGECFRHAATEIRLADPSRPIHWERGNSVADVDSRMYPSVEWLELRGQLGDGKEPDLSSLNKWDQEAMGDQTRGKCMFICEYAHAMGNAIGNFQEYWDIFYRHDSLCGGCIWDWIDQAIWKDGVLAYGGDFDEEPNDGPFNCNGVIDPLRHVTAKLVEVGHVHRNLVVTRIADAGNGFATVFELWNRFSFTRADEFLGTWALRENGVVTKTGAFETPAVKPLARCRFTVPGLAEALASSASGAELFVDFAFKTKTDAPWAEKGWIVARDQVAMSGGVCRGESVECGGESGGVKITEEAKTVTAECGETKAVFSRKTGTLSELVMNGKTVLKGDGAGPRLTCGRAFVDNDAWIRDAGDWRKGELVGGFVDSGLTQLRYHARPIAIGSNEVRVATEVTGSKSAGFTHEATWRFVADGSVAVENRVVPHGTMPFALPRLGLSLQLDKSLEQMAYYGRGPRENYIDRCTGSFLGVWRSTVDEQYESYVRPQDNGYKCDVRWVEFADKSGKGVRFCASEPLFVQALHYSLEDLWLARHVPGQKRHNTPLVRRDEVFLNLDVRQLGLGGNSCGPRTMDKYVFPIEPVTWTLRISPSAPCLGRSGQ